MEEWLCSSRNKEHRTLSSNSTSSRTFVPKTIRIAGSIHVLEIQLLLVIISTSAVIIQAATPNGKTKNTKIAAILTKITQTPSASGGVLVAVVHRLKTTRGRREAVRKVVPQLHTSETSEEALTIRDTISQATTIISLIKAV